jgi:predicted site-specific integrase-resolvase
MMTSGRKSDQGFSFRRPKFRQLSFDKSVVLTDALNGRLEKRNSNGFIMEIKVTVVVAHKDRLARFGYDLIELFSTEVT